MSRTWLTGSVLTALIFSVVCTAQVVAPEGRLESWDEIETWDIYEGIRVLVVPGDTVTFMRIELDAGAKTPNHNHADEQFIYLQTGMARGYVGTIEYLLEPGDIIVIPSWVQHGFEALEDTVWFEVHGPGFGPG